MRRSLDVWLEFEASISDVVDSRLFFRKWINADTSVELISPYFYFYLPPLRLLIKKTSTANL